ncbi:MAG: hypothetical protein LUE29_09205 [Lachnospiraceae bacterium]|nr:hypothetical protein [Lachnospiraceae bacterium]
MKSVCNAAAKELETGLKSAKFWVTTLAFSVLMILDTLPDLLLQKHLYGAENVYTDIISMEMNVTWGASNMFWLRFCLFVLPYGCCFYEEYHAKAAKYRLVRCSAATYGASRMVAGPLMTGISVILSNIIFLCVMKMQGVELLLWMEDTGMDVSGLVNVYGLIAEGHEVTLLLLLIAIQALSGMFFTAMTIMLSAFIRNRYILVALPVVLFFALDSFSGLWFDNGYTQPELTNWRVLFFSMMVNGEVAEWAAVIRTGIYTAVAVVVFSAIFIRGVRKVVD